MARPGQHHTTSADLAQNWLMGAVAWLVSAAAGLVIVGAFVALVVLALMAIV